MIASLVPKQQQLEPVNPLEEWTDDELRALDAWLEAHRAGQSDEGGQGRHQDLPDTFFLPRAESA